MNKVILLGRLTKDPEVKVFGTNNTQKATFGLAVNRKFSKEDKKVDFFNVASFSKLAEFSEKYLKKGQMVSIVGEIQINNWEDKDGNKRSTVEIIASDIYFAGGKNDSGEKEVSNNKSDDTDLPF